VKKSDLNGPDCTHGYVLVTPAWACAGAVLGWGRGQRAKVGGKHVSGLALSRATREHRGCQERGGSRGDRAR
jgi:hypothetical protein